MKIICFGLTMLLSTSLFACASVSPDIGKADGSISVYELRHAATAQKPDILIHGVFQLSIESIMVMDERCADNLVGIDIPDDIEQKPLVKKFYSTLIKNPTPTKRKAVYATVLVSPQYDVTGENILKLTLVDVVSQSVSSAKAWERYSAISRSGAC